MSTKVVAGWQLCDRRDQEINWFKSVLLIQDQKAQKGCWLCLVLAASKLFSWLVFSYSASAYPIHHSATPAAHRIIVLSGGLFESKFLFELLEETLDLASSVYVDKKAQVL